MAELPGLALLSATPAMRAASWRKRRQRSAVRLAVAASLLLHLFLIAAWMLLVRPGQGSPGAPEPPGMEMVFQPGQTAAVATATRPNDAPVTGTNADPAPPQVNLQAMDDAPPPPPVPQDAEGMVLPPPPQHPARTAKRGRPQDGNPFAGLTFARGTEHSMAPASSASDSPVVHSTTVHDLNTGGAAGQASAHLTLGGNYGSWGDEFMSWAQEHLYYPERAASNDEAGTVTVLVTVARDGSVRTVKLLRSSVFRDLDLGLIDVFIKKHLPPLHPDMTQDHVDVALTVDYILISR